MIDRLSIPFADCALSHLLNPSPHSDVVDQKRNIGSDQFCKKKRKIHHNTSRPHLASRLGTL
jgi:hypothetical protein